MEKRAPIQWMGGGLAAASFACLTQIVTLELDKVSPSLKLAVLFFAISIPLDVFIFLTPTISKWESPFTWSKCLYGLLLILFAPITIAGFAAVFWHFDYRLGVLFCVSTCLAYILFACISKEMVREHSKRGE